MQQSRIQNIPLEECAELGFGGGGHDGLDDGAVGVDGAVDGWRDGVEIWRGFIDRK